MLEKWELKKTRADYLKARAALVVLDLNQGS